VSHFQPNEQGWVLVYYEGNLYDAANVVTYADRAMFAYWRMRDRYPTVARRAVRVDDIQQIGILDPTTGLITLGEEHGVPNERLCDWLSLKGDTVEKMQKLDTQLHVKGGAAMKPPDETLVDVIGGGG